MLRVPHERTKLIFWCGRDNADGWKRDGAVR